MRTHQDTDHGQGANDPERVRALAHPLRLALLDYLDGAGEATATQCAQHTGESVANCSFHLRVLARYGFIEPAERRGRERPWRPGPHREHLTPDASVPGSVRAIVELVDVALRQEVDGFVGFLRERAERSGAADEAGGLADRSLPSSMTKDAFWATPEETFRLLDAIGALMEPYAARAQHADQRPAGALLMRWFATLRPDLGFEPTPGTDTPGTDAPRAPLTTEEA